MDIQDKVVIITGASEGIGLATARLFAQEGAKVALAANVETMAIAAAQPVKNLFMRRYLSR